MDFGAAVRGFLLRVHFTGNDLQRAFARQPPDLDVADVACRSLVAVASLS